MFHRMPIDIESPCGHRPGGNGAAITGAGRTYMLLLEKSSNDCDTAPTEPPLAVEVEVGDAATVTAADALEEALAVELLELFDDALEVDGTVVGGFEGGLQVGQLVPPLLQLVAEALALASASRAETNRWVFLTVDPRWLGKTAPGAA